jgi:pimeloyl-ACP methyl ester carboxylesterase
VSDTRPVSRLAALLLALLACLMAAPTFAADAALAREILREARRIVTPDGIEELVPLSIGGTTQWVSIRGRHRANPVLLVLHGGPASPEMPSSWFFQNGWEDYFTVVQWDQRGAGKSYRANDPAVIGPTLSLERVVNDAAEFVGLLRTRLGVPKVFVPGHSWGSLVGLRLAERHPELLYAYIGAGQVIDFAAGERVGYRNTLAAAEAAGNARAVADLKALAPYPDADGHVPIEKLGVERRWSVALGGLSYRRDDYGYYERLFRLSPEYSDADVEAIDHGSALSLPALLPDLMAFNASRDTHFGCPIVMFEGRHDDTTPSEVVADWFAHVEAPAKRLVWFESSAHMMMLEEPGAFLVHLVEDVRPFAGSPRAP